MQNEDGVVAKPIKSIEDLLVWTLMDVDPKLIGRPISSVVKQKGKDQSKTLVCHDLRGNYLDDRFPNGCQVDSAYYLTQWPYMDIFVYFSHNLITIPPVGWINAAHSHGVSVLGTFITEYDDGYNICQQFLTDRLLIDKICRILADIALVYQFDGWLLNIENKIELDQIDNLKYFVNRLTELCKSKLGKGSLVIWYDSVTINGDLKWQNELNSLNKPFFDLCDAIFLNYTWSETNLYNSLLESRTRSADVFVGVDVFGRNCYGGGGFNCRKALEIIKKFYLSTAIFAPGWVFECQSQTNFEQCQWNFWFLLSPYLECNKIKSLPFRTNFNPGKYYRNDAMFLQLSDQSFQPHWFCSHEHQKVNENLVRTQDPNVCPDLPHPTMRHIYCRASPGYVLCVRAYSDAQVVRLFCCDISLSKSIRISLTSSSISSLKQLENYKNISFGLLMTVMVGDHENHTFAYLPSNGKKFNANSVCSKGSNFVQLPLELSLNKVDKTIEISAVLQSKSNVSLRSINLYFNDKNTYLSLLNCTVSAV